MPLVYNGVTVTKVIYNGVDLDKLIYNGVEVFTKYVPPPPPIREPISGEYLSFSEPYSYWGVLLPPYSAQALFVFSPTNGSPSVYVHSINQSDLSFSYDGWTYYRGTFNSSNGYVNRYGIYRIKN